MVFFQSNRWKLYAWLGLGYCVIRIIGGLVVYPEQPLAITVNNIWLTIYVTVVNAVFFEYTLTFVTWKKLLTFILLVILHLALYPFGFFAWRALGLATSVYTELSEMTLNARLSSLMSYAVASLFFFWLAKHVIDHLNLKRVAQQLRIEKQEAELNYLKSQLNPHFLFNTLNNIYSLSREKSDLAPESILRLSKMMRYMLYETSGDAVTVESELNILHHYISLEKLRYDESLQISFEQQIEDHEQMIPPLILIPLIENAFKHGTSETIVRPFVDIKLNISGSSLVLEVKNSMDASNETQPIKENIGISNLRRQLTLMYNEFNLELSPSGGVFAAKLIINLASHV